MARPIAPIRAAKEVVSTPKILRQDKTPKANTPQRAIFAKNLVRVSSNRVFSKPLITSLDAIPAIIQVIKGLEKTRFDETLTKFFAKIARWGVLALGVLSCLSIFGVETTSFAALIGAMGLAIGLAFQGTLSNFASGVMLLIFRPFKVGQFVKVGGEAGTINEIDLFTIALDTSDNRRIIIPNSKVFGATIENVRTFSFETSGGRQCGHCIRGRFRQDARGVNERYFAGGE